jgi:hypothetical protein
MDRRPTLETRPPVLIDAIIRMLIPLPCARRREFFSCESAMKASRSDDREVARPSSRVSNSPIRWW